jgi:hypothetical protein
MDRILDSIIERLGDLDQAILMDDYAAGKDSGLVDLLLVGSVDRANLDDLVRKTEKYIDRKIRTLVLDPREYAEMKPRLEGRPQLLIWDSSRRNGSR